MSGRLRLFAWRQLSSLKAELVKPLRSSQAFALGFVLSQLVPEKAFLKSMETLYTLIDEKEDFSLQQSDIG